VIRLADGVIVRRAPFGGGFVVDPARLAAVEIDDPTVDLLIAGEGICDEDHVPDALQRLTAAGLDAGWLVADRSSGSSGGQSP
jgi:hypothetical protein